MRLLHSLARTHASFDDPNLVSRAGLVPVMALAQRAGLTEMVAEQVRPGGPCGVNAQLKVPCLVAGMLAGADSIMTWMCCGTGRCPPCSAACGAIHGDLTLGSSSFGLHGGFMGVNADGAPDIGLGFGDRPHPGKFGDLGPDGDHRPYPGPARARDRGIALGACWQVVEMTVAIDEDHAVSAST